MTYRAVYPLATLDREELLGTRREKELNDIVNDARKAMAEAMRETPA